MRHAKIQMSRDCYCYAFLHKYWRQNFALKVVIWTELLQVGSKLGMWPILVKKQNTKHHNNNNKKKQQKRIFWSQTQNLDSIKVLPEFLLMAPLALFLFFYFVIIFNCSKNKCCTDA